MGLSKEQQANIFLQGKQFDERDKAANVFLNPRASLESNDPKVIAQRNMFVNHNIDPRDETAQAFVNTQINLGSLPEHLRKQVEAFTGNGPQQHTSANVFMQGYEE